MQNAVFREDHGGQLLLCVARSPIVIIRVYGYNSWEITNFDFFR